MPSSKLRLTALMRVINLLLDFELQVVCCYLANVTIRLPLA